MEQILHFQRGTEHAPPKTKQNERLLPQRLKASENKTDPGRFPGGIGKLVKKRRHIQNVGSKIKRALQFGYDVRSYGLRWGREKTSLSREPHSAPWWPVLTSENVKALESSLNFLADNNRLFPLTRTLEDLGHRVTSK